MHLEFKPDPPPRTPEQTLDLIRQAKPIIDRAMIDAHELTIAIQALEKMGFRVKIEVTVADTDKHFREKNYFAQRTSINFRCFLEI